MKWLISGLQALLVGACGMVLLVFLGIKLDKRPWWTWIAATIALSVIWESAKAGIANSVAKKMGLQQD
jgi:hypothetical protein